MITAEDIIAVVCDMLKPLRQHYVLKMPRPLVGFINEESHCIKARPLIKNDNFRGYTEFIDINLYDAELLIHARGTISKFDMSIESISSKISLMHSLDEIFKEIINTFIKFEREELRKYRTVSKRLVHRTGYDMHIVERINFLSKLIGE